MHRLDVYEAARQRLKIIFDHFEYVYVSFSGGKDSGVLLNMCIDYIRQYAPGRKLGVFHMDYEVQYRQTTEYVEQMLASNRDILEVFHCCVPFKVPTCTSMYQSYWRPWADEERELWVRPMPGHCYTVKDFGFFEWDMWDYDFQYYFVSWLRHKKKVKNICCLVGIRTQESINRWRTIYSDKNKRRLAHYRWTYRINCFAYNAYPIYDWLVSDVWTANGKFHWKYNHLYDLYYQAGIPLNRQRVASPFISEAISTLNIYRAVDPDTWGRMVGRVNGVNFAGIYGASQAMGWKAVKCPPGFSWQRFMYFLLGTLPEKTRKNYEQKLAVSIKFWREKGGCLSDETIQRLREAGVSFTIGGPTAYHTTKKPVRMEYLDDIDIPEFKEIPTYKRMCICILRNDHVCKYMGFALTKNERELRKRVMEKYNTLL